MVEVKLFRELALGFPETVEVPHFHKTSFRIRKKIFATISEDGEGVVKLSPVNQSVFCSFGAHIIYPVPGKWAQKRVDRCRFKKGEKRPVQRPSHHSILRCSAKIIN